MRKLATAVLFGLTMAAGSPLYAGDFPTYERGGDNPYRQVFFDGSVYVDEDQMPKDLKAAQDIFDFKNIAYYAFDALKQKGDGPNGAGGFTFTVGGNYDVPGDDMVYSSYPFNDPNRLDGPVSKVKYTVTPSKITITYTDKCMRFDEFDEDTYRHRIPADPYTEQFKCKTHATPKKDYFIMWLGHPTVMAEVGDAALMMGTITGECTHTCSHSKVQLGKARSGRGYGAGVDITPPWTFTHKETITIDLEPFAKHNMTTKRELMKGLLFGIASIRTDGFDRFHDANYLERLFLIKAICEVFKFTDQELAEYQAKLDRPTNDLMDNSQMRHPRAVLRDEDPYLYYKIYGIWPDDDIF